MKIDTELDVGDYAYYLIKEVMHRSQVIDMEITIDDEGVLIKYNLADGFQSVYCHPDWSTRLFKSEGELADFILKPWAEKLAE